jgi:hypothetical protein
MAYDRYDDRDSRGHRDDRQRDQRSGGNNEERGFFDRAIDSVSNFFSDDESGSRQDQGHGYNRAANNYDPKNSDRGPGYSRSRYEPQAYDQDEGRKRGGREDDSFGHSDRGAMFGGGQSTSMGRGRDEGDYKNQYGRGGGESGGFGRGDYGSQGQNYQARQGQDYGDMGSGRSYPSGYGQTGGGSYRETQHQSYGGQQSRGEQDRQGGGQQSQGSDRYRPITGDYGRSSPGQERQGSGMGGQDFGQQQYGSQERFQDQGSSRGSSMGGSSQQGGQSSFKSPHDQHYSSWRQRQIEELDRDYDEYCREHQNRFENEFSGFRQQRQTKRQMLGMIREHAEVVDENGQHIGTVDKVRGEKIILTKNDPEAHGVHRSFTASLLERVEDGMVYLSGSKDTIRSRLTEERSEEHGHSQGGGMLGGLLGGSPDNDRHQMQSSSNQPTGPSGQTGSGQATGEGPHILDQSFSGTYDDGSTTGGRSTKK